ncbi:MAG TPA: response regulator transcription factor [Micropepsaceae bacterium]|nr:response regulator transcription factor [Micropepsaceae bacterium]
MTGGSSVPRILIVDDEPAIRRFLRTSLTAQGFQVAEAQDGKTAMEELRRQQCDLLVLDLGLPDMDGLEIIERLRHSNSHIPILVLSSRAEEAGKVKALDLGADDYVTKPFGVEELLARVRAALRHKFQSQGETPVFHSGDLAVDLVRRIVTVGEREVKFSPREYDVLRMLVLNAGKVVTHRALLKQIWGSEADIQYLRIYIRALRHKIEPDPERPQYIQTEQGVGYRLRAQD